MQCQDGKGKTDSQGAQQDSQEFGGVGVVVDDQYGQGVEGGRWARVGGCIVFRRAGRARQFDHEFAAVPSAVAVGANAAVVQLDELVGQGESDAQPAPLASSALVERLEDRLELFGIDAAPIVAHPDRDRMLVGVDAQLDAPRRPLLR